MIGHRARFRENDDLPPRRGLATKINPTVFFFFFLIYLHALITHTHLERLRHYRCDILWEVTNSTTAT